MVILGIEAISHRRPDELYQGFQPVEARPGGLEPAPLVNLGKQLARCNIDFAHAEAPREAELLDFGPDRFAICSLVGMG
jgi:hypothetical protein